MPNIPRSIEQTLRATHSGTDSPVMNETLTVIDEHITDLSAPQESLPKQQYDGADGGSESEYSNHADGHSYIAGPETDDEDNRKLSAAEVKSWDHKRTADYLRSIGVEPKHCDIFEEQEISGEVLLDMDQAFIYMKEFDFGVMGRRLRTWHKIRALQDEVKGPRLDRPTPSTTATQRSSVEDLGLSHSRNASGGPILPRIPSLAESPGLVLRQPPLASSYAHDTRMQLPMLQQPSSAAPANRLSMHAATPPSPWRASMVPDSPSRPSAALVREISHSRRHSSVDFAMQPSFDVSAFMANRQAPTHQKQQSFDSEPLPAHATQPTAGLGAKHPSLRVDTSSPNISGNVAGPSSQHARLLDDLDKRDFSGGELDNCHNKVLRERDGTGTPDQSYAPTMLEDSRKNVVALKGHSRYSSLDSLPAGPRVTSPAAKAYHNTGLKGRLRSASDRALSKPPTSDSASPTVTNLEQEVGQFAGRSPVRAKGSSPDKTRRMFGLRVISDAVTGSEKSAVTSPTSLPQYGKESFSESPAGSTTPSAASKSLDIDSKEPSLKAAEAMATILSPKPASRPKAKSKKETSAYVRGLRKISPAEARKDCDHSGWMKKKSSSLVTTWKPRLFVLRGRRLSYYYSEADTEERGIIDISGHKVLVANQDPITTLHATITRAGASPAPASAAAPTTTSAPGTPSNSGMAPFYFKLVPPRAGLSRAVQFTKPTVHYFQVDSLAEGRKWMGEMMKATIEHDLSSFETTNRQKTISLATAQARKERPPFLQNTEDVQGKENDPQAVKDGGLKIHGLDLDKSIGEPAFTPEETMSGPSIPSDQAPDTDKTA